MTIEELDQLAQLLNRYIEHEHEEGDYVDDYVYRTLGEVQAEAELRRSRT